MEGITKSEIVGEIKNEIGKLYAPIKIEDKIKAKYKKVIISLIEKYELYFDESPDIENLIKDHVDWLTSHNYSEIKYMPKFSKHLITKEIYEKFIKK